MIQIRPRWPILAAAAATITYGANHYRLAGLEHLRLEPRAATADVADPNSGAPVSTEFGMSGETSLQSGNADYGWGQRLSVGEKLAMWQDGSSAATLTPIPSSGDLPSTVPGSSALPLSPPIPVPPGFGGQDIQPQFPGMSATHTQTSEALQESEDTESTPSFPLTSNPVALEMQDRAASTALKSRVTGVSVDSILKRLPRSIRVASFNACSLGVQKFGQPRVNETLANMISHFDVVALQEIESSRDDLLPLIVQTLNASGRKYDYLIGPRVGRVAPLQQFAFVFDTDRLETDRYQLYTVDDPQDLINYEPLVAWFRCKEVPKERAFTFSLINVRIDANLFAAEVQLLPKLIDSVQSDGRHEDDWIIAGDFGGQIPPLAGLDGGRSMRRAIQGEATHVDGSQELDNLLFSARSTVEYSSKSGVFDFLRSHNLSLEEALAVSDHLPVWAEFSTNEGEQPGLVSPMGPPAEL